MGLWKVGFKLDNESESYFFEEVVELKFIFYFLDEVVIMVYCIIFFYELKVFFWGWKFLKVFLISLVVDVYVNWMILILCIF